MFAFCLKKNANSSFVMIIFFIMICLNVQAPNGIQVTKTGAVTEPWSKAAIVLYMWSRSPWWLPRAPGVCVFVCCAIYALWVALRWSDVMLLPLIGLAGGRGLVDCANRSPREQRIELLFLYGFTLVTPKANFQNSC